MPPQSRAQRRRQNTRQQQRGQQSRPAPRTLPTDEQIGDIGGGDLSVSAVDTIEAPYLAAPAPARPAGGSRVAAARAQQRRSRSRAPEPVDYTSEYASIRRDLRLIAIWATLLFVAMIALALSGVFRT